MAFLTEISSWEVIVALRAMSYFVWMFSDDLIYREDGLNPVRRFETYGLVIVVGLAITLSASEVTQFMTMDELSVGELLRDPLNRNIVGTWAKGAAHTGNIYWIPVTRFLQAASFSESAIYGVLKPSIGSSELALSSPSSAASSR